MESGSTEPDVAASRQPLSYFSKHDEVEAIGPQVATIFDGAAVLLALAFVSAFIDACQINIDEAPMNSGGSSYTASAPCNEQWQRAHPRFTSFVMGLPTLGCISLLLLFPYMFSFGSLPFLVAIWLVYRTIALRRSRWRMAVLGLSLLVLSAVLPWLHKSMAVIAD